MKNRTIITVIGIALVISICGNIILAKNWTDTRGQVTVFSSRVMTADEQITDLQEQLTDLEDLREQVADLNSQLENSRSQVKALEDTLSENNAQMESMESTIEESNATIAALEEQLAEAQRKQQATNAGGGNSNSNPKPFNPMPGPIFEYIPGVSDSGIGTGAGSAYGEVGTFE